MDDLPPRQDALRAHARPDARGDRGAAARAARRARLRHRQGRHARRRTCPGGEKARLLFALATFHGPHLLILDEPTNHLDVDAREALVRALNDYEGAVILISHDRHLIEACADRLWIVRDGTVRTYDGDMDQLPRRVPGRARRRRTGRGASQGSDGAAKPTRAGGAPAGGRAARRAGAAQEERHQGRGRDRAPEQADRRHRRALADSALYCGDATRAQALARERGELIARPRRRRGRLARRQRGLRGGRNRGPGQGSGRVMARQLERWRHALSGDWQSRLDGTGEAGKMAHGRPRPIAAGSAVGLRLPVHRRSRDRAVRRAARELSRSLMCARAASAIASRGTAFELVAGSILVGRPGDEYVCTHDHHACGDECLSFHLSPGVVEAIGERASDLAHRRRAAAARADGARRARAGRRGRPQRRRTRRGRAAACRSLRRDLSRARAKALRDAACAAIAAAPSRRRSGSTRNAHEAIDLEGAAREAGLSPFHFLRLFRDVLGVTPHQYLVRARLRHAARLLADEDRSITDIALDVGLRAISPTSCARSIARPAFRRGDFRQAARGDRKIFQDRLAAVALG